MTIRLYIRLRLIALSARFFTQSTYSDVERRKTVIGTKQLAVGLALKVQFAMH